MYPGRPASHSAIPVSPLRLAATLKPFAEMAGSFPSSSDPRVHEPAVVDVAFPYLVATRREGRRGGVGRPRPVRIESLRSRGTPAFSRPAPPALSSSVPASARHRYNPIMTTLTDPDGLAMLRTILERPDNDAARLVYADWLEEHGETERAEFIRAQCELAKPALLGIELNAFRDNPRLRLEGKTLVDDSHPHLIYPWADVGDHLHLYHERAFRITSIRLGAVGEANQFDLEEAKVLSSHCDGPNRDALRRRERELLHRLIPGDPDSRHCWVE